MAITQALASTFKQQVLEGLHDFAASGGDTFKIALYTAAANLDSSTTVYTSSGESSGAGYTAGGAILTNAGTGLTGTTAFLDFNDYTWTSATISAAGALIYNSSQGNKAVAILSFGATYSSTNGNFTVTMPAATSTTAIIILN